MARALSLIDRLCQGEEAHEQLFDTLIQSFYLLDDTNITDTSREALELHLILRIVHELGYVGESAILADYLDGEFKEDKIESLLRERKSIITHINNALRESQL